MELTHRCLTGLAVSRLYNGESCACHWCQDGGRSLEEAIFSLCVSLGRLTADSSSKSTWFS